MLVPRALILALSALLAASCAGAAEPVARSEEATLRLVAEAPDGNGRLRGALVIDLEPGWKTYWLDPGEAGLAPALRFSGAVAGEPALGFPVPHRFEEGSFTSIGYDAPTAIAFEATPGSTGQPLTVTVAIGVCQTICVPLQATLELAPDALAEPGTDALVRWAFAALPEPSGEIGVRFEAPDRLLVTTPLLPGLRPDLFLSTPSGWRFGEPEATKEGESLAFRVPVLARPREAAPDLRIDILAVSGERALFSNGTAVDMTPARSISNAE